MYLSQGDLLKKMQKPRAARGPRFPLACRSWSGSLIISVVFSSRDISSTTTINGVSGQGAQTTAPSIGRLQVEDSSGCSELQGLAGRCYRVLYTLRLPWILDRTVRQPLSSRRNANDFQVSTFRLRGNSLAFPSNDCSQRDH